MLWSFTLMAANPPDPLDAEDFREAMALALRDDADPADPLAARGYTAKDIAGRCDCAQSLVHKWREEGNVPGRYVAKLPADVRRLYRERQARRAGAIVFDRDLVAAICSFFGWRPTVATLAPAMAAGTLTRSLERRSAAA